ncbi:5'-3' exonuclease [Stenotrophomonas phage BUCT598]|uniref:5'-3' exonuclease n=1 Tax=Stenotrophomonas phage BUCT598 TaxID=2834253 RepID=A0A8F2F3U7_9CAUD|nr:5'-3' exonuclease [Stenotrophomonas phage BUCT598]
MLTDAQKAKLAAHAKNNAMPGFSSRPLVNGMVLLVDGDYAAYYCAGNDDTSERQAWENFINMIQQAKEQCGAEYIRVHLSSSGCNKGHRYRVSMSPTSKLYQAQRSTGRKPKNWAYLRGRMETYEGDIFQAVHWMDREADDGMALASVSALKKGRMDCVLTADKDMRMFGGLHMVWKTKALVEVPLNAYDIVAHGKQYGHKWFWMQMLQGDQADNILGLPRVGEVAATKALADTVDNGTAFVAVLDMYRSKMGDAYADHFVEQAALLWMRVDPAARVDDFLDMPDVFWTVDIRRAAERMLKRVHDAR